MAITFDPTEKVIQLDRLHVSEKQLWSAFVDWAVLADNLKYGVGMTQLGGFEPIALYVYLELGWKIRPIEQDGITTITGNVLVQGGGSPITPTIGNWQTLVNMETPVKAVAIEVNGGSGGSCSEGDIHDALDTYPNKDDYKGGGDSKEEIADAVWNKII